MSAPSPYPQRNSSTEPKKEDCRDYLRTGRCKYGASCKYNHPANVQSGGGMKGPIDPSEPMFPIRPNEPPCQYYMKHGTCKFGQACKFHHPPQSSLPPGVNGNSMLVGVRKNDPTQSIWNAPGGDNGVQMLPQRPDEPNCIFYLKNGRCKYGSNCRYHHPLNFHERRPGNDDGRRPHIQVQQVSSDSLPKLHYVTSLPAGYQQGHFVVADGTVAFLSIDGSTPTQVISVPQGNNDPQVVYATSGSGQVNNRPLGQSREMTSSSSSASIASSFETASSNIDPMTGDFSSSLWNNRPKRSGSVGSLNAYNVADSHGRSHVMHGNRNMVGQSTNESGPGLPRVVSAGSERELGTMYYDANTAPTRSIPSQSQPSNGIQWRGPRAASFDNTRPGGPVLHSQEEDIQNDDEPHNVQQRSPQIRGRQPPSTRTRRRPQGNVEVDDGLSMMTSALLTMLDTPEEAREENFQGYDYDEQPGSSSLISTPNMGPQHPPTQGSEVSPDSPEDGRHYNSGMQYMLPGSQYIQPITDDRGTGIMMPRQQNTMDTKYEKEEQLHKVYQSQATADNPGWSPSWQGHPHLAGPLQDRSQSMTVMQHSQSSANSQQGSSNVGLFLP